MGSRTRWTLGITLMALGLVLSVVYQLRGYNFGVFCLSFSLLFAGGSTSIGVAMGNWRRRQQAMRTSFAPRN